MSPLTGKHRWFLISDDRELLRENADVMRPNQARSWGISRGVRIHFSGEIRLAKGRGGEEKALFIKPQFGSL